jgi:predicted acetyltransferase
MTAALPIRTITAEEYASLTEMSYIAFLESLTPEALEYEREVAELDRTVGAFDGDLVVGTAGAYTFQLTVPGGTAAAAGVTFIAVRPSHRRRGILTGLMDWLMGDARGRGEPVAILFASEAPIYGRFGFGMASMHQRITIMRGEGLITPGAAVAAEAPRLREAEPLQAAAELARVYAAVLPSRPGLVARDNRWWHHLLGDPPVRRPPGQSPLRCLLAEDESGPRGYALYRTQLSFGPDHLPDGAVRIRELTAADPAATATLWADLLSRDLVGEVTAQMRPIDDPLLDMLADRRRARAGPTDGLWVRLVDLPAALCQRRYAAAVDLVLEVADPLLPANEGRWRLSVINPPGSQSSEGGTVSCERSTDPADLRLPVQALGAAYLGAPRLGQLAAAGQVAELTPGALATLATAMSWPIAPFNGTIF